jgi:coenzyme F420-reducing hydrogenase gamma subunit
MTKPKTAFFDFACCEGCQLQVTNMGDTAVDMLGMLDIVEFREVLSETWDGDLDIAIIEGSITDEHAVERINEIRKRSKVLIAYGSCATIGGVNGIKNSFSLDEVRRYVYGERFQLFPTERTKSVHQVVKVDYFINGCPVYIPEVLTVLKAVVQGIPYYVPDYPVCVECKLNENVCMYDKGVGCFGPVTRAGCNSWCVNNGNICYGCRGMISNPNERGAQDVFRKYAVPVELIVHKMDMYNNCRELR